MKTICQPSSAVPPLPPPSLRHTESSPERRVLVVDDQPINRTVVTRLLERSGFVVDTACNGKEAVRAFAARTYQLVLMDVQMPVMDGLAATAEIRRQERLRRTPIIAITASPKRAACFAAGMDDIVTKPVRMEELPRIIARWVAQQN